MKNIVALLAMPVNDFLATDATTEREYEYKVNFSHALAIGSDIMPLLFQRSKRIIKRIIKAFFELMQKTVEPVRPGRRYLRKHRVSTRKFYACYKPIA